MLDAERAVAVVRNLSHDGVLGGAVGNAVLDGAGLGLAQLVGVLASRFIGDGVHHDLAVGIVGTGDDDLVALDELKAELASREARLAPGQDLGRGNLTGDAGVLGARFVGVGELSLLGVLQDMLGLERTVAVISDGGHDGVLGVAVGDAAGATLDFAQRVAVRSRLVVGNLAHRDLAVGGVGALGDDLDLGIFALALALDELEGELAILEVAAGQFLGRGDLLGDTRLDSLHAIGIGERKCRIAVRVTGYAQLTLAVIGHGEGNLARQLGVVGHANDLAGLGHGVGKGVLDDLGNYSNISPYFLLNVVYSYARLALVNILLVRTLAVWRLKREEKKAKI